METVRKHLSKAAELDALAKTSLNPARYTDLANCYRLLAQARKRLVSEGILTVRETSPRSTMTPRRWIEQRRPELLHKLPPLDSSRSLIPLAKSHSIVPYVAASMFWVSSAAPFK